MAAAGAGEGGRRGEEDGFGGDGKGEGAPVGWNGGEWGRGGFGGCW